MPSGAWKEPHTWREADAPLQYLARHDHRSTGGITVGEAMLLTEDEAAERLRLCSRTLRKERHAGRLPYVLIGRAVRYTISDLESFIERARQDQPACPSTGPKTRRIGNTTSSSKVVAFTARQARPKNQRP
ncbi:helix-turn-helix domain-containing protein [Sphingomonas sanxanigenens]|uniref:helix-turn-helix domain-containing protein n=1 Tax=Sphingomonas sanxanigenens TaxID=397260 RepID=UPI001B8070A1